MAIEELRELKRLALEATPGEWIADLNMIRRPGEAAVMVPGRFDWICSMQVSNQPNWDRDAAYVAAANPAVILGLIRQLEQEQVEAEDDALLQARFRKAVFDQGFAIMNELSKTMTAPEELREPEVVKAALWRATELAGELTRAARACGYQPPPTRYTDHICHRGITTVRHGSTEWAPVDPASVPILQERAGKIDGDPKPK